MIFRYTLWVLGLIDRNPKHRSSQSGPTVETRHRKQAYSRGLYPFASYFDIWIIYDNYFTLCGGPNSQAVAPCANCAAPFDDEPRPTCIGRSVVFGRTLG